MGHHLMVVIHVVGELENLNSVRHQKLPITVMLLNELTYIRNLIK